MGCAGVPIMGHHSALNYWEPKLTATNRCYLLIFGNQIRKGASMNTPLNSPRKYKHPPVILILKK